MRLRKNVLPGEEDPDEKKKPAELSPAERAESVMNNAKTHASPAQPRRGRFAGGSGGGGDPGAVSGELDAHAERERMRVAAAAWDAAAASAPAKLAITGTTGSKALFINGDFDLAPGERFPGGAPVYKRKGTCGGYQLWLYLAGAPPEAPPRWCLNPTPKMKQRDLAAPVRSACCVGTVPVPMHSLPHVISPGEWEVESDVQPTVRDVQPTVRVEPGGAGDVHPARAAGGPAGGSRGRPR